MDAAHGSSHGLSADLSERSTEELLGALGLDHPAVAERLRLLRRCAVAGETSRGPASIASSPSAARDAIVPSAPAADRADRASGVYARSERDDDGEREQGGAGGEGDGFHAANVRSGCVGWQL